jgi:hypothetical protein
MKLNSNRKGNRRYGGLGVSSFRNNPEEEHIHPSQNGKITDVSEELLASFRDEKMCFTYTHTQEIAIEYALLILIIVYEYNHFI